MAIRIPEVGSLIFTTFSAATTASILDGLKTALVDAGWTSEDRPGVMRFTFSGNPTNNQTCNIAGLAYTAKTVIVNANPREFLIGATAEDSAANLSACVNAGSGSGTLYSSATTANPTVTSTAAAGVLTVTGNAVGSNATFGASNSLSNVTLDSTLAYESGYAVTSAATPDGRAGKLFLDNAGSGGIRIRAASVDGLVVSHAGGALAAGVGQVGIKASAGRTLSIVACAHQLFVWLEGDAATSGTMFFYTCPYIGPQSQPFAASAVAAGSPATITTATAHGLVTNDFVYLSGFAGISGINGLFQITVVNSTSFTLNGSTGTGTWTAGTGVIAAQTTQVSNSWAMAGDCIQVGDATVISTLRSAGPDFSTDGRGSGSFVVNNYSLAASVPFGSIPALRGGDGTSVPMWGNIWTIAEARMGWPITSTAGQFYELGEFWLAFLTNDATPLRDEVKTDLFGYNWKLYCKTGKVALWIATGEAA